MSRAVAALLVLVAACRGDTDADTDADTYADADTDTDADADTDADTDPPADADGDGYAEADGDCDDALVSVHPGAAVVCGDGVDQDCDGRPDCPRVDVALTDAVKWTGEAAGDAAGSALLVADLDADGAADVVVGSGGAAYLVPGASTPVSGSLSLPFLVGLHGDLLGTSLALGDVNGDGVDDLLVGAPGLGDADDGGVYLLPGPELDLPALFSGEGGVRAGYAVAGLGDVNGDGFGDALVGGYLDSEAAAYAGAAWLVLGSTSPLGGPLSAGPKLTGEAVMDGAGFSVGGPGDVNGDGLADALVGAPYLSSVAEVRGHAYLVLGDDAPASSALADADVSWIGRETVDATTRAAGWSLGPAGDIDGDGYRDMLVAAARETYVLRGAAVVATSALGDEGIVHDTARVAGVGDLTGDGLDDLVIATADGAWLAAGSATAVDWSSADAIARYTGAGVAAVAGGDVDVDGFPDVVLGVPTDGAAGAVYLVLTPGY